MASCIGEQGEGGNTSVRPQDLCTAAPAELPVPDPGADRLHPLIESDPIMAYIYIALMSAALLIGVCGNTLTLLVIGVMRNMHRTGKVFVANLALADLCVTLIADPMCLVAVIKGESWFDDKRWLCESVAAMCLTACFCAFLSLTLASVNRYIFICHNHHYHRVFTFRTCLAISGLVWVVAFLFEFPNFLGWGGHYFDPKNHQCIWDRTSSKSYTMFVAFALIFTPLLVMLLCYILVFRHIYKTKYNLYQFDQDPFRSRKTWLEALRTSRMLMGIFVVFVVCWTPYGIVIVFDLYKKLSLEVHLFVTMLAHFHSSVNCLVYTNTNRNFRGAMGRLLNFCNCCWWQRGGETLSGESETKSTEIAKVSGRMHLSTVSSSSASLKSLSE